VPNPVALELVDFLNDSWTHYHAVETSEKLLLAAGFTKLSEREEWDVQAGGKYYFIRNGTTIVAFALGGQFKGGNGFNIVAAHTDSPCLKLKPVTASKKSGFLKVGVQTYGGGLWYTWFDRDLSVAGRVLVRKDDGSIASQLVRIDSPILRIPTLAIHLDREVNTNGFKPNTETHLAPVLATSIKAELNQTPDKSSDGPHHALLLEVLAKQLGCPIENIEDFELNVCDTQPSAIGGASKEFIFSGRLDNLAMSYCGLKALIEATNDEAALEKETNGLMVALFDHEEVGSNSAQGAASPVMFEAMRRATSVLQGPGEGVLERSIRNSFLVSADMAHCLHPNYPEKHEENHQPKMHKGLVIKHNANQRYATTAVTSFLFREIAKQQGIPMQDFVVRNDMGCGSTIGPIMASGIGIRTVDVGMPQLSMHSVREMCGTDDVETSYKHFKAFFESFTAIDSTVAVDK